MLIDSEMIYETWSVKSFWSNNPNKRLVEQVACISVVVSLFVFRSKLIQQKSANVAKKFPQCKVDERVSGGIEVDLNVTDDGRKILN